MSEQTVVIGAVDLVKSGTTNGKAWSIYKVKDGNGTEVGSCFADLAESVRAMIGQRALVTTEVTAKEKDGKTFHNTVVKSVLPALEEKPSNGEVDWDGKELRGHIRACYAIAFSAHGNDETAAKKLAEWLLARVYQNHPVTVDATSSFIPPGTQLPDDPPFDDSIPF